MSDINVLIEETLFSEGVGEHFKKHWKKYAVGGLIGGAAILGANALRKKESSTSSNQEKKSSTSSNQEKKTSTSSNQDSKPADDYNAFKNTIKNSVNRLKQYNQDMQYKRDQRNEEEKILKRRLNNSLKRGTFGIPREHPKSSSNVRLKRDFHGESLIGNILHNMFIL